MPNTSTLVGISTDVSVTTATLNDRTGSVNRLRSPRLRRICPSSHGLA